MAKSKSNAPAASGPAKGQAQVTNRDLFLGMGREPLPVPPGSKKQPEYQATQKSMSNYVSLMADPKNGPLEGRPDFNAFPTNVIRIRDVVNVVTNDFGASNFFIYPGPYGHVAGTITTGTTNVSAFGGLVPSTYDSAITADNTFTRVLCYVVEWSCTQAPNSAQGKTFLGSYPVVGATDFSLPLNLATLYDDEGVIAPEAHSSALVIRPFQDTTFQQPGPGNGQTPITMFALIGGVPSATVGQLVITRVVECVPKAASLARFTAKHTPCDTMACCIAGNMVGPGASMNSTSTGVAYNAIAKKSLSIAMTAAKILMSGNPIGSAASLISLINSGIS